MAKKRAKKRAKKIATTKNYVRERQFSPSLCVPGTYRTKRVASAKFGHVLLTLCRKRRARTWSVQSIALPRRRARG